MNVSRVPSAVKIELCRLKFDVHVEEVFSGQPVESGSWSAGVPLSATTAVIG